VTQAGAVRSSMPLRRLCTPAAAIPCEWVTGETRGYFRHFLAYLRDPAL